MHKFYKEVMLDLETLGKGNDAAIVSIGAVTFNLEDPDTYEGIKQDLNRCFYNRVSLTPLRGDVDGDVLEWWFKQSEAARAVFKPTGTDLVTSHESIRGFEDWLKPIENGDRNIWGNGCGFDNIILRSAYRRENMKPSWSFRKDMDVRTIKYLATQKESAMDLNFYFANTIAHNALDDAIRQVLLVQRCWRALNGNLDDRDRKSRSGTADSTG